MKETPNPKRSREAIRILSSRIVSDFGFRISCCLPLFLLPAVTHAQSIQPVTSYIYPAGGQRGTEVQVTVGGYNLTPSTQFRIDGGIEIGGPLAATGTAPPPVPLIRAEAANRAYNYPRELRTTLRIAADAPPGLYAWRVSTANGGTTARAFVVGDLPEIVEEARMPGDTTPARLSFPVTANGRIELAEEVDAYVFHADDGEQIACEVLAERIGSTLDARLEVLDPAGREIAAAEDSRGLDPVVSFTADRPGDYVVRVHDYAFTGAPSHVYRLTVRKSPHIEPADAAVSAPEMPFPVSEAAEISEVEANDAQPQALVAVLPAIIKGRLAAGDRDRFRFTGRKGERLALSVWAARDGSSVDSVLTVSDAVDQELARSDDIAGSTDSELEFVLPADGDYVLGVSDLSGSPGDGAQSGYRLFAGPARPGFSVQSAADHVDLAPGGSVQLLLKVARQGGFEGEIDLEVTGLPFGVTAEPLKIPAKQTDHKLILKAAADADITSSLVRVLAAAKIGDDTVQHAACVALPGGNSPGKAESVLVTVMHPSRFKITADDTYFFRSRGTTHSATIKIEREPGFDGEVVLSLADMQIRYLQGISGPTLSVPAGVSEVTYPLFIPETVELNRTCRVIVAGVAAVTGPDGREHHLLAVSPKQCVMRMEPAVLAIQAAPGYLEMARGSTIELTLNVQRALAFSSAVHLEVHLPEAVRGISAESVDIPADQATAKVTLRLAPDADLARHEGIYFRATGQRDGLPVVADAYIELHLLPGAQPVPIK
jgi:hypothetical protein